MGQLSGFPVTQIQQVTICSNRSRVYVRAAKDLPFDTTLTLNHIMNSKLNMLKHYALVTII